MRTTQDLLQFLDIAVDEKSPLIHIYSPDTSPRLRYVCRFIFWHVLKCQFIITHHESDFISATGYKVNYSTTPRPSCFNVIPHGMLFEETVKGAAPEAVRKNGKLYFFENKADSGNLHFDVFTAVFYFISRYEEWQAFEPDKHGRFETKASLLFTHKAHLCPVVDQWIHEFALALRAYYPVLALPAAAFRVLSTIDVDNLYAYRHKGFVRTWGATVRDIFKLDFTNLAERIKVTMAGKSDPFDVYQEVSGFCGQEGIPLVWFFLFRNGTEHDRTVNPGSRAFTEVFKVVRNAGSHIGLHPSYDAAYKPGLMQDEMRRISAALDTGVRFSRQHYLRFDIRSTPRLLLENGIQVDFSMGFASTPGFRAGTSYPFHYYDFDAEQESALLFVPFCVMDGAFTVYDLQSPEKAFEEMLQLAREIKAIGGIYTSVFHERTFSDHLYKGFGALYKNLHKSLKELRQSQI